MKTKEFTDKEEDRIGYVIGERLGLNQEEAEGIVSYFCDSEIKYMESGLGLHFFMITQRGIRHLESLEEEPNYPIQVTHNTISLGDNANAQIQQNSHYSQQSQKINYTNDNISELFSLLKADFQSLNQEQQSELGLEIENATKQLEKGKDIKSRLLTIGELVKDIGIEVFVSLISSPIAHTFKVMLGIPY